MFEYSSFKKIQNGYCSKKGSVSDHTERTEMYSMYYIELHSAYSEANLLVYFLSHAPVLL